MEDSWNGWNLTMANSSLPVEVMPIPTGTTGVNKPMLSHSTD